MEYFFALIVVDLPMFFIYNILIKISSGIIYFFKYYLKNPFKKG